MAKKRSGEITNLDEIGEDPITSADIHAVVTALSPLKKGRKSRYFDGMVSDGLNSN